MSGGMKKRRCWLRALLALALAGVLAFALLLGVVLSGSHDDVEGQPGIMIILGCKVESYGPSILLGDRLDKALDYWETHPDITIVVSGGQGSNEPTTEAQCMHDYLTAHGVPGERILLEDQSHSTWENLNYSCALLAERGYDTTQDMVVVSNGFHLTRVRMLWGRVWGGDDNLSTLAALSSHEPSRIKMYIREPLALVKSFMVDR